MGTESTFQKRERSPDPGSPRAGTLRRPWFELLILTAVCGLIGLRLVPSHWTSIWMDRQFSGWVAGMANRLETGPKLYTDGAHTPMPPLPTVVLNIVTGGDARWIDESALNFVFQTLTLAMLLVGLRRLIGPLPALLACLAGAASFFSLPKVMLYDSMTQFFVATSAVTVAVVLSRDHTRPWRDRTVPICSAAVAACLLCKQSTGAGLVVGVSLALLVARAGCGFRQRALSVLVFAVGTATFVIIGVLMLTPYADPAGFVRDVVLTGAEPKSGTLAPWQNMGGLVKQVWSQASVSPGLLVAIPLITLVAWKLRNTRAGNLSDNADPRIWDGPLPVIAVTFAAALGFVNVVYAGVDYTQVLLRVALPLCLGILAASRIRNTLVNGEPLRSSLDALFGLACVTVPAALFHNLSVPDLRWDYDNNPLIVIILATIACLVLAQIHTHTHTRTWVIMISAALMLVLQSLVSGQFAEQWQASQEATRRWPDVPFLDGARLRPTAEGMHQLVQNVRGLASSPGDDEVLLLPGDPNVESWIDRPRPDLSSMVIFSDQYWDRYVDPDFERLREDPPRVIVIGPRDCWRPFGRTWNVDTGAERLIDRLQQELIPHQYRRALEQPITVDGRLDHMDVFVRLTAPSSDPIINGSRFNFGK